jgi:nucleotide-binding universal stress UspA family protein
MSGPRRIIIGANGSPGSIRALRYAEDLAHFGRATLVPVIAWTPPGGEMAERRAPSAELRRAWASAAKQRLRDSMDAAWGGLPDGLDVRAIIARGAPGPALVDEAGAEDLLVSARAAAAGGPAWPAAGWPVTACGTPSARCWPSRPPRSAVPGCVAGPSGTGSSPWTGPCASGAKQPPDQSGCRARASQGPLAWPNGSPRAEIAPTSQSEVARAWAISSAG